MRCPKCRLALISGNGEGKGSTVDGSFLKCPKCGYVKQLTRITVAWGKFRRPKEARA